METSSEKHLANVESSDDSSNRADVEQRIRATLKNCPYSFYFNRVTWRFDGKCLTVEGSVPTFYMKQMLQTLLGSVEEVQSLVNNVNVINSTGLSTAQPE